MLFFPLAFHGFASDSFFSWRAFAERSYNKHSVSVLMISTEKHKDDEWYV